MWLLARTASLRIAMLATVFVAASLGVTEVAALQIAMTVFSLLAFCLDSLAIAGQALIGHGLGAADVPGSPRSTRRLIRHGVAVGAALGLVIACLAPVIGPAFTSERRKCTRRCSALGW